MHFVCLRLLWGRPSRRVSSSGSRGRSPSSDHGQIPKWMRASALADTTVAWSLRYFVYTSCVSLIRSRTSRRAPCSCSRACGVCDIIQLNFFFFDIVGFATPSAWRGIRPTRQQASGISRNPISAREERQGRRGAAQGGMIPTLTTGAPTVAPTPGGRDPRVINTVAPTVASSS